MRNKKRKMLTAILILSVLICSGCGSEAEKKEENIVEAEEIPEETSSGISGSIELKEELPEQDIKVPDYLKDGDTDSAKDEEDVQHLNGEEQIAEAREIAEHIEESINQVLTDKDYYPNITGITVNSECTEFNVTFSSTDISLYENVLPMSLCIVGDKFQLYQGKSEDELMTVVNYIDENSGEIFGTTNSDDIQ